MSRAGGRALKLGGLTAAGRCTGRRRTCPAARALALGPPPLQPPAAASWAAGGLHLLACRDAAALGPPGAAPSAGAAVRAWAGVQRRQRRPQVPARAPARPAPPVPATWRAYVSSAPYFDLVWSVWEGCQAFRSCSRAALVAAALSLQAPGRSEPRAQLQCKTSCPAQSPRAPSPLLTSGRSCPGPAFAGLLASANIR